MRLSIRALAPIAVAAVAAVALSVLTPLTASGVASPGQELSFVGPLTPLDVRPASELYPGGLYVDRGTAAAQQASRLDAAGRTADAALVRRISETPSAVWLGDWYTTAQLTSVVGGHLAAARTQGATPVFVVYAIPNRDCAAGYSAGGLAPDAYAAFIRTIAGAVRGTGAAIVLEPDALPMVADGGCGGEATRRIPLLRSAVATLADAGAIVYLDAGHSDWVDPATMGDLLRAAGIDRARGFSTNVANFQTTADERVYAERLSYLVGGKHYVIDTSRNGNGPTGEWCNPRGVALGERPAVGGAGALDATLWIKHPGESDGTCNGGPAAGQWWEASALDLARRQR